MLSPLRDTGPVWERRHGRVGRQAGGAGGGRVSFVLSFCFVSRGGDSGAACLPGADGERGVSG